MLEKITSSKRVIDVLRVIFGLTFEFSGCLKLIFISDFILSVKTLDILPDLISPSISIVIPIVEILLGIIIIFGKNKMFWLKISLLLMILFTVIIVSKLLEGSKVSCGCFGPLDSDKINYSTLLRNIVLIIINLILYFFYFKSLKVDYKNEEQKTQTILTTMKYEFKNMISLSIIFFLILMVVSLARQNDTLKNRLSLLAPEQKIIAPGDSALPFMTKNLNYQDTLINFDKSNALMFIFTTACPFCTKNMPSWNRLNDNLSNNNKVIGIASDSIEKVKKYCIQYSTKFNTYIPKDTSFFNNYRPFRVPLTLIINQESKIEKVYEGLLDSIKITEILRYLN